MDCTYNIRLFFDLDLKDSVFAWHNVHGYFGSGFDLIVAVVISTIKYNWLLRQLCHVNAVSWVNNAYVHS